MAKSKHYVVWVGKAPGIYRTWAECEAQIKGVEGARYKSYESAEEAEEAFRRGWQKSLKFGGPRKMGGAQQSEPEEVDYDSVSVDAGCSGNPGIVEYKGVDTRTGDVLFHHGPISKGTNNLGEFLAIVHALGYLKQLGSDKTIYSDSQTAIKWVKERKVATTLVRDKSTEEIWGLVDRALRWLETNKYANKIVKWETSRLGEIKADFGRK